ncbi:NAD(P)H-hydrate dehydratase [Halocatena halophila]|uniref:NAD(P)H-hydrate dehydratase n=1 Tax=Halocatena halophila TaxID=2814576 RepID=UPI002ED0FF37
MITAKEMAIVDRNATALGVPQKQLMESAGNAIARVVDTMATPEDEIVIVAGRGNNGGDAFVAARFLDSYDPTILLLGRPTSISTTIARENWDALEQGEYDVRIARDASDLTFDSPDLIVDALLGTGVRDSPREPERTAIELINASRATVVSVDVPSGMDPDTGSTEPIAVQSDHVVTFHDSKPGLDTLDTPVTVADIGIPELAETVVERGDLHRLQRSPSSHKGDHGTVAIVGGGPYTGAPALAGQAALRGGADLVRIVCPERVAATVQGFEPAIITRSYPGDRLDPEQLSVVRETTASADVVVLGPGLGTADETMAALTAFLETFTGTCVIDADPLGVITDSLPSEATVICTPHAGEFERMGGTLHDDRAAQLTAVGDLAVELDCTIALKGRHDLIADPSGRERINRHGTPAMTVGGTGDVLAGLIGAFAASLEPRHAAGLATYVNGRAGERATRTQATITPSSLLAAIPEVLADD